MSVSGTLWVQMRGPSEVRKGRGKVIAANNDEDRFFSYPRIRHPGSPRIDAKTH